MLSWPSDLPSPSTPPIVLLLQAQRKIAAPSAVSDTERNIAFFLEMYLYTHTLVKGVMGWDSCDEHVDCGKVDEGAQQDDDKTERASRSAYGKGRRRWPNKRCVCVCVYI